LSLRERQPGGWRRITASVPVVTVKYLNLLELVEHEWNLCGGCEKSVKKHENFFVVPCQAGKKPLAANFCIPAALPLPHRREHFSPFKSRRVKKTPPKRGGTEDGGGASGRVAPG
jgi:hypothetical protein